MRPPYINNGLPTFYRELLQYFQEFKDKTKIFSYGKFLLWNNEEITIDKNTLFWKSWFKKNILSIQDILNADGNFLTFQQFQNKFNIKTNYLHYFQLIAAIPTDLKKKARECEAPSLARATKYYYNIFVFWEQSRRFGRHALQTLL